MRMFQRYTQTARRVIFSGRYMAGRTGSSNIETEHILLGLLREDRGLARRFLGSPWAVQEVWEAVEQIKPVQENAPVLGEIPLTNESKRVLSFAFEEADAVSNQHVCTEHLLLGLLREEESLAAQILSGRGVRLASTRQELMQTPHDDSITEKFVREQRLLPEDVIESQTRLKSIRTLIENAIGEHDFATARALSDEEGKESKKLFLLCRKHGLNDWLYD
jgi:ATP-dependent Clp protease ATP-binding subunit ClpC